MSDKQEPVIDADSVEEVQPSTSEPDEQNNVKTKKRNNSKFYFFLILILGVGTWAFWIFSPEAQQLRMQFESTFSQPSAETNPEPELSSAPQAAASTEATTATADSQETSPLFQTDTATPEASLTPTESEQTENPEQTEIPEQNLDIALESNNPEMTAALLSLQQQVDDLTQVIGSLQQQQLQWSQQQVRAQLFALLRQASSPQSNLDQMMIAWKSIGFLPLLNQDKRDIAEQAFMGLQETQQRIQQTETNIQGLIQTLASEIHPAALQDISQDVANVVDPYQQTDAFDSWLVWLKQQFVITKLDKHALELSNDPYADLKQLIVELNQLKESIHQRNWSNIGSLTSLLYQLEQRGLEASFSNESITNLQASIRQWQDEAQTWMAQL
ncbi:hypothetical protein [Ghiorsea bivora]|uniref:hypothetical protein n=1 Tax=Ghiorsea bivora TaxID=1485545 RepID=UPI0005700D1B|nr:hypothetical protein [Ghiorsea bivora]